MMSPFSIRPTDARDAAAVSALLSASYTQLFAGWYEPELLAAILPMIGAAKPDLLESGSYFVACRDDTIIACGGWTRRDPATRSETPGIGHIRHFATHPDHLRQGAAGALMRHSVDHARAAGMQQLACMSSLPAVGFYRALGFGEEKPVNLQLGPVISFPSIEMHLALA
jgi:predicted N-acetyltransferase YhbS